MKNRPLANTPQCNTGPEGGSAIRFKKNGVAEVVTGCSGARKKPTIDHFGLWWIVRNEYFMVENRILTVIFCSRTFNNMYHEHVGTLLQTSDGF